MIAPVGRLCSLFYLYLKVVICKQLHAVCRLYNQAQCDGFLMTWRPACPANLGNSRLCWTQTSDGKLRACPSQPDATDDDIDVITTGEAVQLRMYRLIRENTTMQSCFPNVEILLRVYLCLNCTGERSFSKLRRINNAQRTTIRQWRLNSIESELVRTIDVNSIIDGFARVKARKHNM